MEVLENIRKVCPVLHGIFLPDRIWPKFKSWHQQDDTVAWHRSIFLIAFIDGYLGRLTSPIHRFLFRDCVLHPDIRQQYLKDLPEQWMFHSDALEATVGSDDTVDALQNFNAHNG